MIAAESRRREERRTRMIAAARGLGRPEDVLGALSQRLDRAADRLGAGLSARAAAADTRLARIAARLSAERLRQRGGDLERSLVRDAARLDSVARRLLLRPHERLAALSGLLKSLSYKGVLERGFALVKTEAGRIVRRAGDLQATGAVSLVFADGERAAHLGEAPPRRKSDRRKPVQKELFD